MLLLLWYILLPAHSPTAGAPARAYTRNNIAFLPLLKLQIHIPEINNHLPESTHYILSQIAIIIFLLVAARRRFTECLQQWLFYPLYQSVRF